MPVIQEITKPTKPDTTTPNVVLVEETLQEQLPRADSVQRKTTSELKVIGFVLCGMLVIELLMVTFENRLSNDVSHLKSFEIIAASLCDEQSSATTVLFLGNSMTRHGFDEEAFLNAVRQSDHGEMKATRISPDNTALAEWYYIYENIFTDKDRTPDLMVIGFGDGHLIDHPSRHPNRLARYYFVRNHWDELTADDISSFEQQCEFVLAENSAAFANRDRIQRRLFSSIIPEYQTGMPEINDRLGQMISHIEQTPTYHRLHKLLSLAQKNGTRIVFVAMPTVDEYEVTSALLDIFAAEDVSFIDARNVTGIEPEMIPDGIHMNADAAGIYSKFLARALLNNDFDE